MMTFFKVIISLLESLHSSLKNFFIIYFEKCHSIWKGFLRITLAFVLKTIVVSNEESFLQNSRSKLNFMNQAGRSVLSFSQYSDTKMEDKIWLWNFSLSFPHSLIQHKFFFCLEVWRAFTYPNDLVNGHGGWIHQIEILYLLHCQGWHVAVMLM